MAYQVTDKSFQLQPTLDLSSWQAEETTKPNDQPIPQSFAVSTNSNSILSASTQEQLIANRFVETAGAYAVSGKWEEALESYKEALNIQKKLYTTPNFTIATTLYHIGLASIQTSRCEEATESYREAMAILEKFESEKAKKQDAELVNCLLMLAAILSYFGHSYLALEKQKQVVAIQKKLFVPHDQLAGPLFIMGNNLKSREEFRVALNAYNEALGLYKKAYQGDHQDIAAVLTAKGETLHLLGRLPEALESYNEALEMLRRIHKENHPELISALKCVGDVFKGLSRFSKATEMYQEALKMEKASTPKISRTALFQSLMNLGDLQTNGCQFTHALGTYQEALQLLEGEIPPAEAITKDLHFQKIVILSRFIIVLIHLNHLDEAVKYAGLLLDSIEKDSLEISSNWRREALESFQEATYHLFCKIYKIPSHSPQIVCVKNLEYNSYLFGVFKEIFENFKETEQNAYPLFIRHLKNSGIIYHSTGFLYEGQWCLETAYQKSKDLDELETAKCLDSLTLIYCQLSQFSKAQESIETAVAIKERINPTQLTMAVSLHLWGEYLIEMCQFEKAKEVINRALQIGRENSPNHFIVGFSLQALGYVFYETNCFEEAQKCYEEALEISGPNPSLFNNLGVLFFGTDRRKKALKYFERAYTLSLQASNTTAFFPIASREALKSLENIGIYHRYTGKGHIALENLKGVKNAIETSNERQHPTYILTLIKLGSCYEQLGKFEKALQCFQQALESQKAIGENHALMADILYDIGSCLIKLDRNYDEAFEMLQRALEIRETFFGKEHPLVAIVLDKLAFYHSYLGDENKALEHYMHALEIRKKVYPANHSLVKLSESHIEITQYDLQRSEDQSKAFLNREEFEQLALYAKNYLDNLQEELTLEKNPTGFIRIRLPCPDHLVNKVEMVRLHYWPAEFHLNIVEAPHNHPTYFESMVLQGGYTHAIHRESKQRAENSKSFVAHRILKNLTSRNIFAVDISRLEILREETVSKGAIIQFPRDLVHQVLESSVGTVTINCVFKHKNNRSHYEVFLPPHSPQDPQTERETLLLDESNKIVSQLKTILENWKNSLNS